MHLVQRASSDDITAFQLEDVRRPMNEVFIEPRLVSAVISRHSMFINDFAA